MLSYLHSTPLTFGSETASSMACQYRHESSYASNVDGEIEEGEEFGVRMDESGCGMLNSLRGDPMMSLDSGYSMPGPSNSTFREERLRNIPAAFIPKAVKMQLGRCLDLVEGGVEQLAEKLLEDDNQNIQLLLTRAKMNAFQGKLTECVLHEYERLPHSNVGELLLHLRPVSLKAARILSDNIDDIEDRYKRSAKPPMSSLPSFGESFSTQYGHQPSATPAMSGYSAGTHLQQLPPTPALQYTCTTQPTQPTATPGGGLPIGNSVMYAQQRSYEATHLTPQMLYGGIPLAVPIPVTEITPTATPVNTSCPPSIQSQIRSSQYGDPPSRTVHSDPPISRQQMFGTYPPRHGAKLAEGLTGLDHGLEEMKNDDIHHRLSVPPDVKPGVHQYAKRRVRCLIVFADDDIKHVDRVVRVAECVKKNQFGVTVDMPQSVFHTKDLEQDFLTHLGECYDRADFVLVCASPKLRQIAESTTASLAEIKTQYHTSFIFTLIRHEIKTKGRVYSKRFITLLFSGVSKNCVPKSLRGTLDYQWPSQYMDVLFKISQPERIYEKGSQKGAVAEEDGRS